MRAWIWTFIVFAAAVALALVLHDHSGNFYIVAPPWHISISITFGVMALIALFIVLYLFLNFLSWLTGSPQRFKLWRHRRAERRDQDLLQHGWIHIQEGRYAQAEKELAKLQAKSKSKTTRVVAGLAAARAAQHLGHYVERDQYLSAARKNAATRSALKLAYATAAAEMYLERSESQKAIELLQPVQDANSRHFHATHLLLQAYKQLDNYERVYELTRLLLRRSAIDKNKALEYIEYAATRRIQEANSTQFKAVWDDLRTEEKHRTPIALAAALHLNHEENYKESKRVLEAAIHQEPAPELLSLYALSGPDDYKQRLSRAEEWLQRYPDDPAVLVTLGRLCIKGQIWGQAEHYLKRSMALRNDLRIHALLGQLYDALARTDEALYHWRIAASAAGALPIMAPNRLLPPAELHADPTLVDGHVPPKMVDSSAQPLAASAVAEGSWKTTTSAKKSTATAKTPDEYQEQYFDTAPIPGVDSLRAEKSTRTRR